MSRKNEALMLKAASLYYKNKLTQQQIAKRFDLSRPTIVRMLKRAVDEGFVEIRLTNQLPRVIELETIIETIYGSNDFVRVIVADILEEDSKISVARAAVGYLEQILQKNHIVGIGWGSTLAHVPQFFKSSVYQLERIVQLGGYLKGMGVDSAQHISIKLAHALKSPVELMSAPMLLKNIDVMKLLLEEHSISETIGWFSKCNLGLVEIGKADKESIMLESGHINEAEIDSVLNKGAVGEVLYQYFDLDGHHIETPWSKRMISVDFVKLRDIDNLIGVAAGKDKVAALHSVIMSGTLNTVVIDVELAEAIVLKQAKRLTEMKSA